MSQYNNIKITPNIGVSSDPKIEFIGAGNSTVTLKVLDTVDGGITFEGQKAELLSLIDADVSFGSSIPSFGVNDYYGIPQIQAYNDGRVIIAPYGAQTVGIGTTNPTYKLDVNGGVRITQTGTGNALVVEDSANPDATAFVIDDGGRIGVGTDNPNGNGLSLFDTSLQITSGEGGGKFGGLTLSYESAFDAYYIINWFKPLYIGGGDDVILQNNANNVGIGTTNPTQKLDVVGNVKVTGDTYISGNTGIGTTNPTAKLDVAGDVNVDGLLTATNITNVALAGTFTASPGVAYTMDSYTLATDNIKTAEYTIHIENGSNIQAQKLLVMQNGTTAFSQEYAIMFDSDSLVSIASTLNAGVVSVEITPETGVLGLTTYRYIRQSIS